jgi:predicted ribonuclease YlaK
VKTKIKETSRKNLISKTKKTFILDTNVLLSDAECLRSFQNNDIVLPLVVIEELDRFKDKQDDVGKNAREISRQLIELVKENKNDVKTGISLGKKLGKLKILNQKDLESNVIISIPELDYSKGDNKIVQFCLEYKQKFSNEKVILVTRDLLLRIKAISVGIECEDYKKLSKDISKILNMPASESEFYTGIKTFKVSKEEIDKFYQDKNNIVLTEEEEKGLYPNQFIVFESDDSDAKIAGRFLQPGKPLRYVPFQANAWNIKSKNMEQAFLLDLLLDDSISLVTISSRSGAGKTLISLAAALELTLTKRKYNKILITRNIQALGKDIGALPGPQPLDAKILTPTGWTTMGNLKIGDQVISRDGKATKVIGIYPKGIKEVFRIKTTEGQITECCEDHLWLTKTFEEKKTNKPGKIRSTKEIINSLKTITNNHKIPNHYLPRNKPIEFSNVIKFELPPYTLGALLANGLMSRTSISISKQNKEILERIQHEISPLGLELKKINNHASYTFIDKNKKSNKKANFIKIVNTLTSEEKIYSSVGEAEKVLGIKKTTIASRCKNNSIIDGLSFSFVENHNNFSNRIKNILNKLNLIDKKAHEKFIPKEYIYNASIEDRISLLQGLIDIHGTIKKNGNISFKTISETLKNNFIELIYSLGGKAIAYKRKHKANKIKNISNNYFSYDIRINLPNEINPFFLDKKVYHKKLNYMYDVGIVSIDSIGQKPVQCIKVENEEHLYITDNFIVTHNTLGEKMEPWIAPFKDNLEFLLNENIDDAIAKGATKSKKNENLKHSFAMQDLFDRGIIQIEATTFIRGRSIPKCIFLVDESQNLSLHEMKTILTRVGEGTKIVLLGDHNQIDNTYLNKFTNGLVIAIEKFKGEEIAGHISLVKGERSKLATVASELL